MATGRRSDSWLSLLGLVAISNGVLLGLSFFGVLAVSLELLGRSAPPTTLAIAFGALAGLGFLGVALNRQRTLREGRYRVWGFHHAADQSLLRRFRELAAATSLHRAPALCVLDSPDPNAFAVGRSRDDASIVVTSGLLDLLDAAEQNAVLAQQLAQVESGAIKEVGFADAVADTTHEIVSLRGRFLWGPRQILAETLPVWITVIGMFILVELAQGAEGLASGVLALAGLILIVVFVRVVLESLWGLLQLFLFVTFFGPLTAIEAVLAPPTTIALVRLTSRTRISEADARSVELTGDAAALVSALEKFEFVERLHVDSDFERDLRFALFVAPRAQSGLQAWIDRAYATHPTITERIEDIRSAPEPAPAAAGPA